MPRRLSLRNRLILFAAACLLPLLVVIAAILAEAANAGREQVLDAQAATSEVVASVLAATLTDNQKVLQELASINAVRGMEVDKATDAIDQFSRRIPISTVSFSSTRKPILSPAPGSTRPSSNSIPRSPRPLTAPSTWVNRASPPR